MSPLDVDGIGVLSATHLVSADFTEALRREAGAIPESDRQKVADYLRSGAITFASMEYTHDLIGGDFGTSGGSGLLTDGRYFWRGDAANYVAHHGVGIQQHVLDHMAQNAWIVPVLAPALLLELDSSIRSLIASTRDVPRASGIVTVYPDGREVAEN
jgi:hypothetical protein